MLDQALCEHHLNLPFHFILHGRRESIWPYIDRLCTLYEGNGTITRPIGWKAVWFLKQITEIIQKLLNLWWQLVLLQDRLLAFHIMQFH
jgi:hypothetical protein